jgi:hypothetical protein
METQTSFFKQAPFYIFLQNASGEKVCYYRNVSILLTNYRYRECFGDFREIFLKKTITKINFCLFTLSTIYAVREDYY